MTGNVKTSSQDRSDAVQIERAEYAAQIRAGRAALGWSQSELAQRAGLALRSVMRLEQGEDDVRRSTAVAVEQVLRAEGLVFEALPEGGFRLTVPRRGLVHRPDEG